MARSVYLHTAMSARRILDYTTTPSLHRPLPVPIPTIETDTTGTRVFDTTQCVSMVIPINLGQFNDFLEEHIETGLVPTAYMGTFNPLDDDFWLLIHNHPLADQDHTFLAIIYPGMNSEIVITEGILPALDPRFNLPLDGYRGCITRFCQFVRAYLSRRLTQCNNGLDIPLTVTCRHSTLCITFYPVNHEMPILIRDHNSLYIVPERAIPGHWIDDDSSISPTDMEEGFPAIVTTFAQADAVRKKDPSLDTFGDPCDLANFLPDSGAMQHMTPYRADLFNAVEGQNLGVKVADGHIIKCSVTGKIQLRMLDDNGAPP